MWELHCQNAGGIIGDEMVIYYLVVLFVFIILIFIGIGENRANNLLFRCSSS